MAGPNVTFDVSEYVAARDELHGRDVAVVAMVRNTRIVKEPFARRAT